MFLSHAVLTNKPGVQSIFAGGPLPVPSSPPSDPYRPQPGLPSITRLPTAVFAYKSRLLAYELRRRWASLILAEQLRGGLDAVQRRRRPDACRSLFAVASGVRAIRSSA